MKKINLYIILFSIILIESCLSENTVEVNINQGDVLGKVEKTFFGKREYYAFRGIPYAAAPVNELRFKPPTAHEGWEGTYEALEKKPTCMQFSARMRNGEQFGLSGSEDCLYLSVFTPDIKGKLPVIVFDYNDNFRAGFNGTDTYSPENFIDENVITVMINHRFGFLGYLTTEDEVIPGNNGLRDFIFGLQWVKENIAAFGGDPEKVTLMGSCSGGALVNMLLYSEKAKGLFSSVIIQSGTAFEPSFFAQESRYYAFKFGEKLNISTADSETLLKGLQAVDVETLFKEELSIIADHRERKDLQFTAQIFTPTEEKGYDDVVLTQLPENAKIANDVPVLIGFNSREGLDYLSHFIWDPRLLPNTAEDNLLMFPIRVDYQFERDSGIYKKANTEIRDFYFETKNLDYTTIPEYTVYAGDSISGYAVNYAAKKLASDLASPVFYYLFDFMGQFNENSMYIMKSTRYSLGRWGATISDDLCYLHICGRVKKYYETLSEMASEQREIKVLKRMVRMWTNFAKYGNPTPAKEETLNGVTWEPIKKNTDQLSYLHITKFLKMKTDPLGERARFWDEFLEKYSKLAVDGVVKGGEHDEL